MSCFILFSSKFCYHSRSWNKKKLPTSSHSFNSRIAEDASVKSRSLRNSIEMPIWLDLQIWPCNFIKEQIYISPSGLRLVTHLDTCHWLNDVKIIQINRKGPWSAGLNITHGKLSWLHAGDQNTCIWFFTGIWSHVPTWWWVKDVRSKKLISTARQQKSSST